MGMVSWLRGLFSSPLQHAISTLPSVDSDELPRHEHQNCVHKLAIDALTCWADLGKNAAKWEEMTSRFDEHPLLGLEVLDEALVLYKNGTGMWGRLEANQVVYLTLSYSGYNTKVTDLRGGRVRRTTTPTLKGGGRRVTLGGMPPEAPIESRRKVHIIQYYQVPRTEEFFPQGNIDQSTIVAAVVTAAAAECTDPEQEGFAEPPRIVFGGSLKLELHIWLAAEDSAVLYAGRLQSRLARQGFRYESERGLRT